MSDKKTNFRILAEGLVFNKLKDMQESLSIDNRVLTVEEIKKIIREEFGKAKDVADTKPQDPDGGWQDAELENDIDFMKALNIKEFFNVKK